MGTLVRGYNPHASLSVTRTEGIDGVLYLENYCNNLYFTVLSPVGYTWLVVKYIRVVSFYNANALYSTFDTGVLDVLCSHSAVWAQREYELYSYVTEHSSIYYPIMNYSIQLREHYLMLHYRRYSVRAKNGLCWSLSDCHTAGLYTITCIHILY